MKWLAIGCLVWICTSCFQPPTVPEQGHGTITAGGRWVLCEGLWRQNNSTLSYISQSGVVLRDAMRYVNGVGLGDTPSDILLSGDTMIIAVNTSRKIVLCSRSSGKLIATIPMPGNKEPYRLARYGRTVVCTNLNDDSISELDLNTGTFSIAEKVVGPAPEGIAVIDSTVYVALSGLGDLRVTESGAGTVTLLSTRDLRLLGTIAELPNVGALLADPQRKLLWCAYRNLASKPNLLGGVVVFDAATNKEVYRWQLSSPTRLSLDSATGNVYVLHTNGVDVLNHATGESQHVIAHRSVSSDVWYSLAFDNNQRTIWIGNARGYVTDGEVLEYNTMGVLQNRYVVGPNPSCIIP